MADHPGTSFRPVGLTTGAQAWEARRGESQWAPLLGYVLWSGRRRGYEFSPLGGSYVDNLDAHVLRDIAEFLDRQTREQRSRAARSVIAEVVGNG